MKKIDFLIKQALEEDIGKKDLTTELLIPDNLWVKAKIVAKENGVIAGLKVAEKVFRLQIEKPEIRFLAQVKDGGKIKKGQIIAEIYGRARTILTAERVTLNLLSHLSGITTLTRKYVDAIKQITKSPNHQITKIYDTRKTTPLWRELEKYAVRCGGGYNHRMNLGEQILIKDNHLKAVRKLGSEGVRKLRERIPKNVKIEMETENLNQVREALDAGVDIVMLDNMSLAQLRKAVDLVRSYRLKVISDKPEIEVSGGVNLKNIKKIVRLGIERISVGEITHSVPALDMSLEIRGLPQIKCADDRGWKTQIAAEKTKTNLTMG